MLMEQTYDINKKLDTIEDEIASLKSMIIKITQEAKTNHIAHLKGILKGTLIEEGNVKEAKKSLFKAGA